MKVPRKWAGIALALVATGLTVTGVTLAATDPNPSPVGKDPLALNGYPPHSAQLHVVVSTGQRYQVSADVNVNFDQNAVSAALHVPLAFSTTDVDLRLVGGHLYLSSSALTAVAGPHWLAVRAHVPDLYGLALEATRPDVSLISGFSSATVTHSGYSTTYSYHLDHYPISLPKSFGVTVPPKASIDFSITLGRQGELTAMRFVVASGRTHAWISVTVVSYNHGSTVAAPPRSSVTVVSPSRISSILGGSLGGLLGPSTGVSLGPVTLS
ncbi:MAG TPA: hypothetical protein VGS61_05530 [Acidimicrobiales bacterium]|nr:hypothetical protein [Acidimicrobiales bacterium]